MDMSFRVHVSVLCAALVFVSFLPSAAAQSTCDVSSSDVRSGLVAIAVIVGGIPSYFARDGRSDFGAGVTTLGPSVTGEPDPVRLTLEGNGYGGWGDFGYRVAWFDTSYPVGGCYLGHSNSSIAFAWTPFEAGGRELRVSLGPGYGLLPRPAFSINLGLHYEAPLGRRVFVSTDAIYMPNRTDRGNLQHASRLRAAIRWDVTPSFQPFLAAVGGITDSGVVHTGSPVEQGLDSNRPGLYASGLLGFESRWGPANY